MPRQWKEIVRLRFKGPRFEDSALDLAALIELTQFQKIVAETSRALWYAAHPGAGRLPNNFENRIRLCLRRIEPGSAVAPLEVELPGEEGEQFWPQEPLPELSEAVGLAYDVVSAVEHDQSLPGKLPKSLVAEYAKWGQTLLADEEVELTLPGRPTEPARVSRHSRERLQTFADAPYEDTTEIVGEVFEADVRQKKFQIRLVTDEQVSVAFTPDQEQLVTGALKDHESLRVRVRGRAQFTDQGKPRRFIRVEDLCVVPSGPEEYNPDAPAIEDVLEDLACRIPPEEWNRLPSDLTDRLDHYLYGANG